VEIGDKAKIRRSIASSNYSNVIITRGLHPPWNSGEVVTMRNIVFTIKLISRDEPIVYSLIDKDRFEGKCPKGVHYVGPGDSLSYTVSALKSALSKISEMHNDIVFLHLSGVKQHMVYLLSKLYSKGSLSHTKIYPIIYDFGEIPTRWRKIPRSLHLHFNSIIGKILTTSLCTYKHYAKYIRMYYLPVPYLPPEDLNEIADKNNHKECFYEYDDVNSFGYIGHLYEHRFPYRLVLKTTRKLISAGYKNLVLVIIAPRTRYNVEMSKLIRNYAHNLGLEKNLLIMTKNINEYCKHRLLKYFKIFLFIPIKQPISMDPPISVIEAMASQALIVTTKYLSLEYFIKNGVNGIIIEALNIDTLYEKIKNILDDNYLMEQITQNAREYILKRHHYKNVAKMLRAILEENT